MYKIFFYREILSFNELQTDDSWKSDHLDDVWLGKYHKWKVYPFAEAIECHRETHHPTCYNLPNAFINAYIELDMHVRIFSKFIFHYQSTFQYHNYQFFLLQGEKPTKMIEAFTRTVNVPHAFDHGENRTVIAFAKTPELLQLADKAGAAVSGDIQLIKKIQVCFSY